VVLGKAEGTGFLRAAPRVGDSVPVHATAVGKLFLAFGGGSVAVPEGELERFTGRTRVSALALEREVRRTRERGFADNREEWIPGLAVIAAPILRRVPGEPDPRMAGALAVAAPAARLEALGPASVAARVCAAAARVAAQLEGEPS
jgi:DNA-binding IclR family transcriptional regulator